MRLRFNAGALYVCGQSCSHRTAERESESRRSPQVTLPSSGRAFMVKPVVTTVLSPPTWPAVIVLALDQEEI